MSPISYFGFCSRHLRVRHKLGLCDWQVSGEIFWEVGGIEEEKAIRGLDQRLAAVGEFLAVALNGAHIGPEFLRQV